MPEITERQPSPRAVPAIYECIRDTVSTDRLIQQIMQDWFGEHDREKLFLGLSALLQRENAYSAIRYLQTDTSGLGELLQQLPGDLRISNPDLEELVGLQRMPHAIDYLVDSEQYPQRNPYAAIQLHLRECIQAGVLPPDATPYDLMHLYDQEHALHQTFSSQAYMGTIRPNEILTIHSTFGAEEPTYLELLGPLNILRLREMTAPTLLLVGAQYPETVIEFSKFIDRLNPNSRGVLIDIDPKIERMLNNVREQAPNLRYYYGDILNDSFSPNSIDVACTNHLLRSLIGPDGQLRISDRQGDSARIIERFMRKMTSVLKPNGQLLSVELGYSHDDMGELKAHSERQAEIEQCGRRADLRSSALPYNLHYELRKHIGSARISPNGLPHYGDGFITKRKNFATAISFTKPK